MKQKKINNEFLSEVIRSFLGKLKGYNSNTTTLVSDVEYYLAENYGNLPIYFRKARAVLQELGLIEIYRGKNSDGHGNIAKWSNENAFVFCQILNFLPSGSVDDFFHRYLSGAMTEVQVNRIRSGCKRGWNEMSLSFGCI